LCTDPATAPAAIPLDLSGDITVLLSLSLAYEEDTFLKLYVSELKGEGLGDAKS
jgi:hypothetical protein